MKDVWRRAVHALVMVAFLASSVPSLALASRDGVVLTPTPAEAYVGEMVHVLAEFVDYSEDDNETAYLTLSDGDNGGTFYGASGDVCGSESITEPVTINSNWGSKNFCYSNEESGTYTIVATLQESGEDSVDEGTTQITFVAPAISLDPLPSSTLGDLDTLTFSGVVNTNEGGTKMVASVIYTNFGCDSSIYNSVESPLIEEGEYDFTFSGEVGSLSAGEYSIQSELFVDIPGEEETVAVSQCLNFTVTPTEIEAEGYLTIEKQVEGFEGGWTFNFTGDAGAFMLSNIAGDEGETRQRDLTVLAGEVEITEAAVENWQMTGVTCEYQFTETRMMEEEIAPETPLVSFDEESHTFVVDIAEEESVYCVVTNTYTPPPQGELIIEKVVTGFEGEWTFDFAGSVGDFTLTNSEAMERKVPWMEYFTVPAGVVTIDEEAGRNWQMASVVCEYENIYAKIFIDEETDEEMVVENPLVSFDPRNGSFVVDVPDDTSVRCVVTNTYNPRTGGSSGTRVPGRASNALPSAPKAPVVALTTAVPTCEPLLASYLRMGWDNNAEQVKKLQAFLTDYGFPVPVTGHFGPLTEAAVRAFQAKYLTDVLTPWGISEATGFVFKTTRHKINNLVCAGSEEMPVL